MHPTPGILSDDRLAVRRLAALWALHESAVGGLLHAVRSPFTGLVVGGGAVLLIAMIAHLSQRPARAILQSLLIVLIVKSLASPHAPPTAYLAVAFQGLLGALLFGLLPGYRLAAALLGPLALLESALQKLLTLTLLFGKPLWAAIDALADQVLQQAGLLLPRQHIEASPWLIGAYLGIYLAAGLAAGWLAARLPARVRAALATLPPPVPDATPPATPLRKPWYQQRRWLTLLSGLLLLALAYGWLPAWRARWEPLWLLMRTLGVVLLWFGVLMPLLGHLLRQVLQRQARTRQAELTQTLALLPDLRRLSRQAWRETAHLRGWRRWDAAIVRLLAYALAHTTPEDPAAP
ncbi:MAG: hypothetical protein OHK0039_44330 [Bacteroidia bacterium]